MNIGLIARCDAVCQLTGDSHLRAVFRDYDKKEGGYHCGLGKTDCIIVHLEKELHECYQKVEECSALADQAMKPQKRFL